MASGNSRDVELNLRVQTLGADGIKALETQVRELAAQGGAAAPAFTALAEQIAKLGQDASAFNAMQRLAVEVDDLAQAIERANTTTLAMAQDLVALNQATREAAAVEQTARQEYEGTQRALASANDQIKANRASMQQGKVSADEYKAAQAALRAEIVDLLASQRQWKEALDAAAAQTQAAAQQESVLQKALSASTRETEANARALAERKQALIESRAALEGTVLATNDLAAASASLATALQEAQAESGRIATAEAERAQAARANFLAEQEIANEQHRIMERRRVDAAAEAAGIIGDYEKMQQASAARVAALRAEAAEEDRLAKIVAATRAEMTAAANAEAAGIIADFNAMAAAEVAAAEEGAAAMRAAFQSIGTASLKEVEAEIARVREAMMLLAESGQLTGGELSRAMQLGQARVAELELKARDLTGTMSLVEQATAKFNSTFGEIAKFAVPAAILAFGSELAKGFVEANLQLQKMRLGLNTLYHDADITTKQIDFLAEVSNRAGVSFGGLSGEFIKFSASMQQAGVPLAQVNSLFSAVTQAAGTLGLAGSQVERMLNALGQMAAKGTVSMEELRRQLGDSLPGALGLTAKGLGITESQLIKLVETGGLMTRDLIPALTTALQGMGGEVNTVSAGWERLKNALTTVAQSTGDAGGLEAMGVILKGLGIIVASVVIPLQGFLEVVFGIAKAAGILVAAMATMTSPFKALGQLAEDAGTRLNKTEHAFDMLIGTGDQAATSQKNAGNAIQQTGQQAQRAAQGGIAPHTTALQANATAATQVADANQAAGSAHEEAAAKAALAGKTISQVGVEYGQLAKTLENNVEVARKLVKARALEGESLLAIAKMTGSEVEQLDLAVTAANSNLDAHEKLAAAQQAQADKLRAYVDVLKQEVIANGDANGARKTIIDQRERELKAMDAAIDKTHEQINVEKTAIAQADTNRRAHENNAAAVEGLAKAYEAAKFAVEAMRVFQSNGQATQEQVTAAIRTAAQVTALYRDALNDVAAAVARTAQAAQNKNLVTQAGIKLEEVEADNLLKLAERIGDTTLATQANIDKKEIEIKSRMSNATAMDAESAQLRAQAEALKTAAQATGDYNEQKQAEYDRLIAGADAKSKDAEATRRSTDAIGTEVQRLRDGTSERDTNTDSINKNTDALVRNNAERAKPPPPKTADGFETTADGSAKGTFTNTLPTDQAFKLAYGNGSDPAHPTQSSMTLDEAKAAFKQAEDAFKDMQAFTRQNPGASSIGYQQSTTALYTAARSAYERIQAEQAAKGGAGKGTAALAPAPGSTSHTVTINLNGQASTINTASAGDATTLAAVLKQLETSQKAA